jgi:hypothetical protein
LDLKFLAASVNNYWNQQHALPARSSDLVDGRMTTRLSLDPESKQPYDYRVTEANHYELCATFRRRARVDSNDFWFHEAGRRCFSFDAGRSPY